VQKINDAMNKTLALPEVKQKLADMGYEPWPGAPKAVADRAAQERAMWGTVTKGLQVE
jgi:tripartite-type tricarboxylate transporter receptor subunit TctC